MITIKTQIECVEREIALRKRVYPRWVSENKMAPGKADKEIAAMEAVRLSLLLMPKDAALIEIK